MLGSVDESRLKEFLGGADNAKAPAKGETKTTIFYLKFSAAKTVGKTLTEIYEGDKTVKIDVNVRTNSIVVEATADRLKEIEELVKKFDAEPKPRR